MTRKALSLSVLAWLLITVPASAQRVEVDLAPLVGLYVPTASIYEFSDVQEGVAVEIEGKHNTAFLFGGRVTVWVTEVFGLDGAFAYAPSDVAWDVRASDDGFSESTSGDVTASVWQGSLKGLFNLTRGSNAVDFFVGGGLALVGRGGDAYDEFQLSWFGDSIELEITDGGTDIGAAVDIGVAVDLSEVVAIRFDIEDYVHSVKQTVRIETFDFESDAKLQNDLTFSGGVVIRLGG